MVEGVVVMRFYVSISLTMVSGMGGFWDRPLFVVGGESVVWYTCFNREILLSFAGRVNKEKFKTLITV